MRACWPSRKSMFPAGGSVPRCAAPRPTSSRQPAPQRHTSFSKDFTIFIVPISRTKKEKEWRNCTKLLKVFWQQENTREKLPKRSLQSCFFAVNCMCKANASPQKPELEHAATGRGTMKLRRTSGMRNMLLKTIGRQCGEGHQGLGVTSCQNTRLGCAALEQMQK